MSIVRSVRSSTERAPARTPPLRQGKWYRVQVKYMGPEFKFKSGGTMVVVVIQDGQGEERGKELICRMGRGSNIERAFFEAVGLGDNPDPEKVTGKLLLALTEERPATRRQGTFTAIVGWKSVNKQEIHFGASYER